MYAIGIIDTIGFVGSVEAADTCLKTANVEFVNWEKMSGGIVSLVVKGDVGAVTASVAAGVEASKSLGGYLRHTVIARLDDQTESLINKGSDEEGIDILESYRKYEEPCISPIVEKYEEETAVTITENENAEDRKDTTIELSLEEELSRKTVSTLRKMANKMEIRHKKLNTLRKAELISFIMDEMGEREE